MKKQLVIDEKRARQMYPTASPEMRAMLEDSFTKDELSGKITDHIKSYKDACAELGETPHNREALLAAGILTLKEILTREREVIVEALNEGRKIDMLDTSQKKFYPFFSVSSSGFAFRDTSYCCSFAYAGDGSRLCIVGEDESETRERAAYLGKTFTQLFQDIATL